MQKLNIAIIGAGPAGLACAEFLSNYADFEIHIYEQKTSAGRKFLMAGKTGLNISHNEPFADFIQRYDQVDILKPILENYHAKHIQNWMKGLGIQPYIGSSGRIFPVEMKAAPLLRAWLKRLIQHGVQIHYQKQCLQFTQNQIQLLDLTTNQVQLIDFDVIVLACGGASWQRLGSDGLWQKWFDSDEIEPLQASNVGVLKTWSPYMQDYFGQPLKRIRAWSNFSHDSQAIFGEMVISHYGLEGGLVYRCQRELRQQFQKNAENTQLFLDLIPDVSQEQILAKLQQFQQNKKLSLNTQWQKIGLDKTKIALLRELTDKTNWANPFSMSQTIKKLPIFIQGFRPLDEAISSAGGIKFSHLNTDFSLKRQKNCFICGEMLNWDAPTGGYLLTACLATGRFVGQSILRKMVENAIT